MAYYMAWWNLENLFDTEHSPERPRWLQDKLASELQGWSEAVLAKKIRQLAHVISAMNDQQGPDILGVCEVESKSVVNKLINQLNLPQRNYAVVHANTQDQRGIDVAIIYDKKRFTVERDTIFNHVVLKRNATRDILQATFKTLQGSEFVVMANHWPSRRGGKESSAPYRMMAGETLAYWHQRTLAVKGEIPIFVMGDFNDEPFDISLENYALSTRTLKQVTSTRVTNPYLFNLMWPLLGHSIATHSFNKSWGMLDQILVNRAALKREGIYCLPQDITIFQTEGMIKNNAPVRFSRPASRGGVNEEGFSDHLPIAVTLQESL